MLLNGVWMKVAGLHALQNLSGAQVRDCGSLLTVGGFNIPAVDMDDITIHYKDFKGIINHLRYFYHDVDATHTSMSHADYGKMALLTNSTFTSLLKMTFLPDHLLGFHQVNYLTSCTGQYESICCSCQAEGQH